jgi:hypothetical protein
MNQALGMQLASVRSSKPMRVTITLDHKPENKASFPMFKTTSYAIPTPTTDASNTVTRILRKIGKLFWGYTESTSKLDTKSFRGLL